MGPEGIMEITGDKEKYEIWETKFLDRLRSLGLKDILDVNLIGDEGDNQRNEEAYAELVQFLEESWLLIIKKAADNGRKALNIFSRHYTGKGKPRVISLYTQLTSLRKDTNKSVTETILITLRNSWSCFDNRNNIEMLANTLRPLFHQRNSHQ